MNRLGRNFSSLKLSNAQMEREIIRRLICECVVCRVCRAARERERKNREAALMKKKEKKTTTKKKKTVGERRSEEKKIDRRRKVDKLTCSSSGRLQLQSERELKAFN